MGTIINILNVRISEFKEFSLFFLEKEIEYKEDNKEIFYIYKFTSLQKHFLKPHIIN